MRSLGNCNSIINCCVWFVLVTTKHARILLPRFKLDFVKTRFSTVGEKKATSAKASIERRESTGDERRAK